MNDDYVPYDFDEALAAVQADERRKSRRGLRPIEDPEPADCTHGLRFCERCKWKDGYSLQFLALRKRI